MIKVCKRCGNGFSITKNRAETARFCSRKCRKQYGWNKDRIDATLKDIYRCEWCERDFENWKTRPNRFCSAQCRSEYAASVAPGAKPKPESYVELNCQTCGEKYSVHKTFIENGRTLGSVQRDA